MDQQEAEIAFFLKQGKQNSIFVWFMYLFEKESVVITSYYE